MFTQISIQNIEKFNATMDMLASLPGTVLKEVIPQEAKLLALSFMDRTPPYPRGSDGTSLEGKRIGMAAVRADISRSITKSELIFNSPFINKSLEKLVKKKDYAGLNAALKEIPDLNKWSAQPFTEDLHIGPRNRYRRYGHIKEQHIMTLDDRKQEAYTKKVEGRVGMSKAGWAISAFKLGATEIPAWVKKHFGYCKGYMIDGLNEEKPFISIENDVLITIRSKMDFAISVRTREMQEKIAYRLKYLTRQGLI